MYLVDTSGTPDPDSTAFLGRQVKPDISCYSKPPPPGACITRARDMETFIEIKNREIDEPYCDHVNKPFEHDTKDSRDTCGQLAAYLNAIQATQNRTHTWYLTFQAIKANSDEAHKAHRALGLGTCTPLFKVPVTDHSRNKTTFYIVSKPFTNNDVLPVDRGTHCYEAYDCQTHQVVLLKDTWRVRVIFQRVMFIGGSVKLVYLILRAWSPLAMFTVQLINAAKPRVSRLEQGARPFGATYTTNVGIILNPRPVDFKSIRIILAVNPVHRPENIGSSN
jgi:hypothetical protein